MRTDHIGRGLGAAGAMDEGHRRAGLVAQPGVAPSHHRDEDRVEFEAFARQAILDAARVAFAAGAIENAVAHEIAQARAEDVARDAGGILKLVKAMAAEKGLAQDEHRPSLADY